MESSFAIVPSSSSLESPLDDNHEDILAPSATSTLDGPNTDFASDGGEPFSLASPLLSSPSSPSSSSSPFSPPPSPISSTPGFPPTLCIFKLRDGHVTF